MRGGAFHYLGSKQPPLRPCGGVFDQRAEYFGGDTIEAGNRQVARRHQFHLFARRVQAADGDHVVGADDGVRQGAQAL